MSAPEPDQVQAWRSYARSYDKILPALPFYQEVVSRHITGLLKPSIERVIDIGTGTGSVAAHLIGQGVAVTAVDISQEMLDQLHEKLPVSSLSLLCSVQRNAESLNCWTEAWFDGANVLLSLFAMSNPLSALGEIIRVVRPGGRIMLTEPKRDFEINVLLEFAERFLREQGLYEQLRDDWKCVREANLVVNPSRRERRISVEEIAEILCSRGFTVSEMRDSHLGQCATLWGTKGSAFAEKS